MKYNKPALPVERQIQRLMFRDMHFDSPQLAARHLGNLNYYRMSGYWMRYQRPDDKSNFRKGTSFEKVLADYAFDRSLRLLVLDAVEAVEVSIRTRWAYELSLKYGAHAHLDYRLFKSNQRSWDHSVAVALLVQAVEHSREGFIRHFRDKYDEPLPPIWAVVEIMSLGQISRWFSHLRHAPDRRVIAKHYEMGESLLSSLLHHTSVVRNICAHHSRLWDRKLPFMVQLPKKNPARLVPSLNQEHADCLYNTLTLLAWLVSRIDPASGWVDRVKSHILAHAPACTVMGCPPGFQNLPVWQERTP